jgi:hypothetical protein
MKTLKIIATACMLALPSLAAAAGVEVRELHTNQIPENPAKLIDIAPVNADQPAITQAERREDEHDREQRAELPRPQIPRAVIVPALGAPVAPVAPPHIDPPAAASPAEPDRLSTEAHK